jgi:hypothetical protein
MEEKQQAECADMGKPVVIVVMRVPSKGGWSGLKFWLSWMVLGMALMWGLLMLLGATGVLHG